MLGIGQLECVSYGVVCGVFYCVESEKALISEDGCRKLRIELRKLVFEMFFSLNVCALL